MQNYFWNLCNRWNTVTSIPVLHESVNTWCRFTPKSCVEHFDFGVIITKTCLYNFDPIKTHFYKVKLGFTGVYIIFLISAKNIECGYSLEPPRRAGSNGYPQSMFCAEIWKKIFFYLKNCHFLVVKFSVYLNRRVFVMCSEANRSTADGPRFQLIIENK